ncbi:MAG: bifunctional phosphoglucose/phosphomannose isomerase [Fimbriimonas sp.]
MPLNLDDRAVVTELDPKEMLRLTEEFGDQCRKALQIAQQAELPKIEAVPGVVALAGMGGSAAGGDFVRALMDDHGGAPFVVVRDYHLPNYIGVGDVVFCASYSGNTEETLAVYEQAKKAGSKIMAVTSGGKLAEMAREDDYPLCIVPGGQPPRSALGLMMVPVLYICTKLKVLHEQPFDHAFALLDTMAKELTVEAIGNPAKKLAEALHGNLPILYGLGTWQGLIANRWRSQINENAKQLAFFNSYPELNHNEILGWVNADQLGVSKYVGVVLQDGTESAKMKKRAEVTERLLKDVCEFHHVTARGESLLERLLSLAYFGDFVSIYLARLNNVDPETIDSINVLKEELSRV